MLVLPEEEGEGEKRKVVVRALEAGETSESDHCEEELLDVLDHSRYEFLL